MGLVEEILILLIVGIFTAAILVTLTIAGMIVAFYIGDMIGALYDLIMDGHRIRKYLKIAGYTIGYTLVALILIIPMGIFGLETIVKILQWIR